MVGHLLWVETNGLEAYFEAVKLQVSWWLSDMQLFATSWRVDYRHWRMIETWDVAKVFDLLSLRDLEFILPLDLAEVRRSILIVTRSFNPRTL